MLIIFIYILYGLLTVKNSSSETTTQVEYRGCRNLAQVYWFGESSSILQNTQYRWELHNGPRIVGFKGRDADSIWDHHQKNNGIVGLIEFEQFLLKHYPQQAYKNTRSEFIVQQINHPHKQSNSLERKDISDDESSTFGSLQLTLQQITAGQLAVKIPVSRQGLKIGRNSSNDLVIPEAEVSRNHAEITYKDGNFYLKDLASTTGTFIKIIDSIQIKVGNVIEVGSNMLQVEGISSNKISLSMVSEQGPKLCFDKPWNIKGQIGIGRKSTNDIIMDQDSHMSNNHAVIFYSEGKCYFKDLATTNGSWFRLSGESSVSRPYQLKQQTVFKIGPTITYACKFKYVFPESSIQMDEKLNCVICYVNTRDCVIQPCNHSNTCMKCCKNLKECPICRIKVQQTLKIYHT